MGVDKESRRKRKIEAEKDCGPVDCMKLQYVFSYNLRGKNTRGNKKPPVIPELKVAKSEVVSGNPQQ